ncbi:FAD-dependent oxidoreductase [Maliponia aquimaris]|uniref:Putative FAD-binding dehydrogenase n=1 Tax=Maliponia aquimaris TaxID=1673631 RepID=A0A238L0J6_9RHOB|nr:FAD-dependent oxidoreductase [Maliponia aquimaris]SMX48614.1 putative FAD-binding dehydrogenase [Maliponia aquimaris]
MDRYDVVVAGGGSAGVAAAVGAADCGARVLLVERAGFLGGAATLGQVLAWCGFYPQVAGAMPDPAVAGVGRRALDHLAALGLDVVPYFSASGNWPIRLNPEAVKLALDRLLAESGAEVVLHSDLAGVTVNDGRIESVTLRDPRGLREVSVSAFVDATGDAELAFLAGATPCPLHDGHVIQPASLPVRIGGVAPGASLDKPARAAVLAGMALRHGRAELRADGGILTTLPGMADLWWLAIDVETNGLDGADLAQAERDGRELAWAAVDRLRALPGYAAAHVSVTGPKVGIRETRHARSLAPLREDILLEGKRPEDSIALGAWPMEILHGPGRAEYRRIGGDGLYGVPLGALRSHDLGNLMLAGRCLGADPAAYASARVMGTAFATGQAAGVAAALGTADAAAVRRELLRQGALV